MRLLFNFIVYIFFKLDSEGKKILIISVCDNDFSRNNKLKQVRFNSLSFYWGDRVYSVNFVGQLVLNLMWLENSGEKCFYFLVGFVI